MLSMITGLELIEFEKTERNLATGQYMKPEPKGIWNPLTGMYDKEEDVAVAKAAGVKWPSLVGEEPVEKSDGEEFELEIPFTKADEQRQLVYGVIYSPDEVDSQNDQANALEIEKAAHDFLANSRVLKLMHRGKAIAAEIVESYIAPEDFELGKQTVKKGSWVAAVHVSSKKIWKAIVDGELTGFSMAGKANSEEAE